MPARILWPTGSRRNLSRIMPPLLLIWSKSLNLFKLDDVTEEPEKSGGKYMHWNPAVKKKLMHEKQHLKGSSHTWNNNMVNHFPFHILIRNQVKDMMPHEYSPTSNQCVKEKVWRENKFLQELKILRETPSCMQRL